MSEAGEPAALLREAARLEQTGQLAQAAVTYERILARWPALADCWYNLGLLQRRLRRFDAALSSYARALALGIRAPEEVHLNRAVILADDLRQEAAAEQELRRALALNGGYLPALRNLANLLEDLGAREEALATYVRILELEPRAYESLARYAGLQRVERADDALIARLRAALADPQATRAERASLGFALGAALDACGEYAAAFEAYSLANRDSRASAPAAARYDRRAQERYVDELIRTFGHAAAPAGVGAAPAPAAPRPIFICGMFRSGSTLTEQLLARHPLVHAGGELDLLPALVRTELNPYPAALAGCDATRIAALAEDYLGGLARLFPGSPYVTDKRPDNFLHIGLIKRLMPHARIVHTTRDGLDNCLSVFFLHLDQRMSYALDLADIGHYYRQYQRLMRHWHSLYGADLLDFSYDSLVAEPRAALERLLAFCGLPWEEACLTPAASGAAVKTASVWQVRQPLYRRSSGRARHYRRELEALAAYLAAP
jgi:tetratricopeptide (TPR) repeat protein